MEDQFKNKYRRDSTRLQHWDYGSNAAYFVTLCTKNRVCSLGDVVEGEIQLSETGIIANILWYEIKHHAINIGLDAFVVMPNHVHGIIFLHGNIDTQIKKGAETRHALSKSVQKQTTGQNRFQNQGKNTLSSIMGGYKSAVTKHARRIGFEHNWQPRFYEHIIRNQQALEKIQAYIIDNPLNWKDDRFYRG
ncbi:transposase [Marinicella gelatinilytica]|uniref:transposase n=1 Tax=Marinicella gelatinilytica TaxID=2996017 RepID=UPI002260C220|nr:transposase [Marinicella gelatinilytica]MCX7544250.1 hypothetical protein [Marinicella gelatinilytica]